MFIADAISEAVCSGNANSRVRIAREAWGNDQYYIWDTVEKAFYVCRVRQNPDQKNRVYNLAAEDVIASDWVVLTSRSDGTAANEDEKYITLNTGALEGKLEAARTEGALKVLSQMREYILMLRNANQKMLAPYSIAYDVDRAGEIVKALYYARCLNEILKELRAWESAYKEKK